MMIHKLAKTLCCGVIALVVIAYAERAAASDFTTSLRTQIEEFISERAEGPIDSISVPSLSAFEIDGVDPQQIRVELSTRTRGRLTGSVAVSVVLSDGSQVLKRAVISARVRASEKVWVASRTLTRGTRITESDLRLENLDAKSVPSGATSNLEELVGLQLRRSLREGAVLRTRYVEAPSTVQRGQIVRLVVEMSGLMIVGKGRAVTDGAVGEHSRVVNTDSRREVVGLVSQDGSVHVGL